MSLKQFLPDIKNLAKKDSDVSTKRYADLRLINHVIFQSWVVLMAFIYFEKWEEVTLHFIFLSALCFGRGLLAKDNFLNKIIKNDKSTSSDS
jgi:hypothetical protein